MKFLDRISKSIIAALSPTRLITRSCATEPNRIAFADDLLQDVSHDSITCSCRAQKVNISNHLAKYLIRFKT